MPDAEIDAPELTRQYGRAGIAEFKRQDLSGRLLASRS